MSASGQLPPLPDVVVDYDQRWLPVDLAADPGQWAAAVAPGIVEGGAPSSGLVDLLAGAATIVGSAGDSVLAYLLLPTDRPRIVAAARIIPVPVEGSTEEVWTQLREQLGGSVGDTVSPVEQSDLPTPAGTAMLQRARRVDPTDATVSESVLIAWNFAQLGWALVLTTSFADLVDAGRYGSAVEDLARGLRWRADVPADGE